MPLTSHVARYSLQIVPFPISFRDSSRPLPSRQEFGSQRLQVVPHPVLGGTRPPSPSPLDVFGVARIGPPRKDRKIDQSTPESGRSP